MSDLYLGSDLLSVPPIMISVTFHAASSYSKITHLHVINYNLTKPRSVMSILSHLTVQINMKEDRGITRYGAKVGNLGAASKTNTLKRRIKWGAEIIEL